MKDAARTLIELQPQQEFFVGIDSDGCVFDTMEIKHKECFCPQFVSHFSLQSVSKYAREAWEFVNLYSKTRGLNRFPALIHALDLLRARREVKARSADVPRLLGVRDWIERETRLGNPALEAAAAEHQDCDLAVTLGWTKAVNTAIEEMVHGIPPFPGVRDALEFMAERCDTVVVSQTPVEALDREWGEHQIAELVRLIAGQEMGTKTEHIALATKGKYAPEKILMIGDAPGDLKAAKANHALFYPINPGAEEASWERLNTEALKRFIEGSYAGAYEQSLIDEFNDRLPAGPPWEK